MIIPKLFDAGATSFSGLGLGFLAETIDCTVTEERNGSFECEFTYPISGNLYDDVVLRNIIYVDVNSSGRKEPFRIYRISRPMNGIITVNAAHISYDLSGVLDLFFSASSLSDAMQKIKAAEIVASNFTFSADFDSDLPMSVDVPTSVRSILGGMEGSLIDTYGGELDFEKYNVSLKENRGQDRGVVIRYGKNLTDIKQDEDSSSIYTHVFPFWYKDNSEISIPLRFLDAPLMFDGAADYNFSKIYPLDLSNAFSDDELGAVPIPTDAQIEQKAREWMASNNLSLPSVNLDVKFYQITNSSEYSDLKDLETVNLCDTVTVYHEQLGINIKAKVTKVIYKPLLERYDEISIGSSAKNAADTIVEQGSQIKKSESNASHKVLSPADGGTGVTSLSELANRLGLNVANGLTDTFTAKKSSVTQQTISFEKSFSSRPMLHYSLYRAAVGYAGYGNLQVYYKMTSSNGLYTGATIFVANNYTSDITLRILWDAIGTV